MKACLQITSQEFAEVSVQQTPTPTTPQGIASASALQYLLCLPFWTSEFALINVRQTVGQTTKPETVFLINAHRLLTLTLTVPHGHVLLQVNAPQNP
jgi:hypothetical protein